MTPAKIDRLRLGLRFLLAAAFLVAGILHIRSPGPFLSIVPGWVPAPRATVFFTGACEIAGAIALFVPRLRWWAGVMLAAYAVCVYPANIKHAMLHLEHGVPPGWWYHGPRLLFQPVIVWWSLFAGCVVDWPFRRRG